MRLLTAVSGALFALLIFAPPALAGRSSWDGRAGPLDGLGGFSDLHDTFRSRPGSDEPVEPASVPIVVGPFNREPLDGVSLGQFARLHPYLATLGVYDDNYQKVDKDLFLAGRMIEAVWDSLLGLRLDVPVHQPEVEGLLVLDYTWEDQEYVKHGAADHVDQDGEVSFAIDTQYVYLRSDTRYRNRDEGFLPEMGPLGEHNDLFSSHYVGIDIAQGFGFKLGFGYQNIDFRRDSGLDNAGAPLFTYDHQQYAFRQQYYFGLTRTSDVRVAFEHQYGVVQFDGRGGRNDWTFNEYFIGGYGEVLPDLRMKVLVGWARSDIRHVGAFTDAVPEFEGIVGDAGIDIDLIDRVSLSLAWVRGFEAAATTVWSGSDQLRFSIHAIACRYADVDFTTGCEWQQLPGLADPIVFRIGLGVTAHLCKYADVQLGYRFQSRSWAEDALGGDYMSNAGWIGLVASY